MPTVKLLQRFPTILATVAVASATGGTATAQITTQGPTPSDILRHRHQALAD